MGKISCAAIKLDMEKAFDRVEWPFLKNILAQATGQSVNLEKSSILFSPNTPQDSQNLFRNSLHLTNEGFISKYLKVPHCVGRKTLWNLPIPQKIKHFTWKAFNHILPCALNLFHKKFLNDPFCRFSGGRMESVTHALIDCNRARTVWKHSKFKEFFSAHRG
uniref:Reverse transcriptase zinc-binding domain-containing protein n=1 Tax=Cannabis sativa TaxID=3483 RepID=A0A803QSH6_CANSA